jgi:hypothetical protein
MTFCWVVNGDCNCLFRHSSRVWGKAGPKCGYAKTLSPNQPRVIGDFMELTVDRRTFEEAAFTWARQMHFLRILVPVQLSTPSLLGPRR